MRMVVSAYLRGESAAGALDVLARSAHLLREIDLQQRAAVRRAVEVHSWAEIGAALGVSKQAAHRKFVKGLAADLRSDAAEIRAAGRARKAADVVVAARSVGATAELMRRPFRDS